MTMHIIQRNYTDCFQTRHQRSCKIN